MTATGGSLDESPKAHRRLPKMFAAHADTIDIVYALRWVGMVMASAGDFDRFKD